MPEHPTARRIVELEDQIGELERQVAALQHLVDHPVRWSHEAIIGATRPYADVLLGLVRENDHRAGDILGGRFALDGVRVRTEVLRVLSAPQQRSPISDAEAAEAMRTIAGWLRLSKSQLANARELMRLIDERARRLDDDDNGGDDDA